MVLGRQRLLGFNLANYFAIDLAIGEYNNFQDIESEYPNDLHNPIKLVIRIIRIIRTTLLQLAFERTSFVAIGVLGCRVVWLLGCCIAPALLSKSQIFYHHFVRHTHFAKIKEFVLPTIGSTNLFTEDAGPEVRLQHPLLCHIIIFLCA